MEGKKKARKLNTGEGYLKGTYLGDNILMDSLPFKNSIESLLDNNLFDEKSISAVDNSFYVKNKLTKIIFPDVSGFEEDPDINFLTERVFTNFTDKMYKLDKCLFNMSMCDSDYFIKINFSDLTFNYSLQLFNNIQMCLTSRYNRIFIPIKLIFSDNDNKHKLNGHSNLIIVDKKVKKIYFFEPHGQKFSGLISNILNIKDHVIKIIKNIFTNLLFFEEENLFDNCGVQSKQVNSSTYFKTGGFCLSWSLLAIHLSLLNINVSVKDIISRLIRNTGPQLDSYIKKYTSYLYMSANDSCIPKINYINEPIIHNIKLTNEENEKISQIIQQYLIGNLSYEKYLKLFIHFRDFDCRYFTAHNEMKYIKKINEKNKIINDQNALINEKDELINNLESERKRKHPALRTNFDPYLF